MRYTARQIGNAIKKLTVGQREYIIDYTGYQQPHEIAISLGISIETVFRYQETFDKRIINLDAVM